MGGHEIARRPAGRIKQRFRAWEDSGATSLTVRSRQPEAIEVMAQAAGSTEGGTTMRFKDKVALITAVGSGIGRATADIMAQRRRGDRRRRQRSNAASPMAMEAMNMSGGRAHRPSVQCAG